jgi:hypothetical protein
MTAQARQMPKQITKAIQHRTGRVIKYNKN